MKIPVWLLTIIVTAAFGLQAWILTSINELQIEMKVVQIELKQINKNIE
jgi:hypothetical protein